MKFTLRPVPPRSFSLAGLFSLFILLLALGRAQGATIELCPLLTSGATVTLNAANTYSLSAQCWLSRSVTIFGNGATISGTGPLGIASPGGTLVVDDINFTSSGWGALAAINGGQLVVQNGSSISCPNGTGVYSAGVGSTATVQNSSISASAYGVQVMSPSTAGLHAVTITGCPYAVQLDKAGAFVTIDGNSLLEYAVSNTTGVGILNGASGVVRDTTIRGFLNGIDVRPMDGATSSGTVDVQHCLFDTNGCSGLSAVYANNVHFANSTVLNAQQDGIYFYHSTGVIDKSQVIGSLNSGVSFEACPDGATIQNSLVKDNAHQGINVVECQIFPCPAPVTPSLNIKVLNNTLVNNHLANILITENASAAQTPPAQVQGNIFAQAPAGIYLGVPLSITAEGPQGVTIDSALVTRSTRGVEIRGTSNPKMVLSDITENNANGILIYEGASLTAAESIFWNNGLAPLGVSDAWSIFVNGAAGIHARVSTFGPAGKQALYDNNSAASCDVAQNFWDATDGPYVPSWSRPPATTTGSGALIESPSALSTMIYSPFATLTPVSSSVNGSVSLASGGSLSWNSQLGLTIVLNAHPGSTALSNEILGVLRVNDTWNLEQVTQPDYLLPGELFTVWISASLRFNSASGFLLFSLPSESRPVDLKRRDVDGSWSRVTSTWDQPSRTLTYSPADLHLLNGTFAITEIPDIIYVKKDSKCSSKTPCYSSILSGIGSMLTNTVMNVTQETFAGNIVYNYSEVLTLAGGWDLSYASVSAYTIIQGGLTVQAGTLVIENVIIK